MIPAPQKSVTIEISRNDLEILKENGFKLCFAKKVEGGDYNIVWQSYDDYLNTNTFSWTAQFQLFGVTHFQDETQVEASTNIQNVALGETCVLAASGNLGTAATGGPDISITLINNYGSIYPGLNQLSKGIHGKTESTRIYVALDPVVKGSTVLTPVDKVLVWFEQHIETGTVCIDTRTGAVEIDLTDADSATRLFDKEVWSTPTQ